MYIKITTKKAAAWFDSFQLEKGVLTEYRPEIDISAEATVKNSMYLQNKKAEAVIHIQHQGGIKKKLLLSWIINTVYGNVLQKKEIILDLTKKDTSSMKTEIPSGIQGVMNMVIILTDENKNFISQSKWRYFVIDSFDKFQNPMLGYQNDGIDQWPLWLINTRAEILSFLGIGYTKIALFMLSHSDASKSYDTAIKNITKINKDYGLEVMAHIDFPAGHNLNAYTYRKKEKFEEPSVDEDKAYAEFFGKHFLENNKKYSGYIDKWYIFGEPNLYRDQNGKSIMPPERAAGIYKAVYEQAAKSGEKVFIGGSMNGSDFTYLDKLFQNNAGKYMDRMNYHSYRVSPESPFLYGDIIKMREIINRYNKNIGLVNGEQYYGIRDEYTTWGEFGAHYFADDEADHAGRMVQNFLHHLAAGIQMCYFNCKGTIFQIGRSDPVHYYYAYSGLRAASKFLNGVKKGVYFEAHKSLRTFIFEKPDGIRLVTVNTREFGKNGAMELPACSSHACDFNGNRLETRNLSLSWLPSYIFFKKNIPAEEIIAELRNIKYKGLEIPIQIAYDISEDKDKITMTLSNPYGSPVPGKLYFKSVPAGWSGFNDIKFDLKANSTLDCSFNVPQSDFKWKNDIRIDYALECGDIIEDQSARFPTIFAKKIKNLKIDADLADWNGAEWMSLGEDTMLLTELTEKSLKRVYKGRNDFTGDIAVSWDENSFFIALKAHDDEIVFNGIPGIFWQSDSFQLYFDQQNNAKKGKNYDSDDAVYQIGLDQNGKPVAWLEKNPT
ncbi:MAG TPA: hypothetical protein DC049_19895, partial [Spirochaetia bacterium]|nr:hypothetical protein [Spirochaetia bacterium]